MFSSTNWGTHFGFGPSNGHRLTDLFANLREQQKRVGGIAQKGYELNRPLWSIWSHKFKGVGKFAYEIHSNNKVIEKLAGSSQTLREIQEIYFRDTPASEPAHYISTPDTIISSDIDSQHSIDRNDLSSISDTDLESVIPILVACALDFDLQNSLNMGVMFFS